MASCSGGVGCVERPVGWPIEVSFLKPRGFLIFLPFGLPILHLLHCAMFGSIVVLLSLKSRAIDGK